MNQITNHYHQTEAALFLYKKATDAVKTEAPKYCLKESLRIIDEDLWQLLQLLNFNTLAEAKEYLSDFNNEFKDVGNIEIDGNITSFDKRITEK